MRNRFGGSKFVYRVHRFSAAGELLQSWGGPGQGPGEFSMERPNLARHSFEPRLQQAGLPKIRFHDLRHSAATLLLSQGENPKVVQERLGHSTIGVTMDTYSHVLPDIQRGAAERLDRFFSEAEKDQDRIDFTFDVSG